jgi:general secretion pathway protein K
LLVLGVVLLTSFLITKLVDRAATELQVESRAARRASLRDEAYSALEVALAVLADASAAQNGLHSPSEGWDRPLEFAGYTPGEGRQVEIAFDDETGRLSLPAADEPALQRLLLALDVPQGEAERFSDALFAWTKAGHVARFPDSDPRRYELERPPYAAPQRALRSLEELRAIPVARELLFTANGDWNETGHRFRAAVSVHSFRQVNINTAHAAALVALGLDPARADTVVAPPASLADAPPQFFRSVAEAAAVHGNDIAQPGIGADVRCLRMLVLVREGGRTFSLAATIHTAPGDAGSPAVDGPPDSAAQQNAPRPWTLKNIDYPFRILELRESDLPVL